MPERVILIGDNKQLGPVLQCISLQKNPKENRKTDRLEEKKQENDWNDASE